MTEKRRKNYPRDTTVEVDAYNIYIWVNKVKLREEWINKIVCRCSTTRIYSWIDEGGKTFELRWFAG